MFTILFLIWLSYMLFKPNNIDTKSQYTVQLIKYSKGPLKAHLPLMTWYLVYPRFIHSEMMTHKDFSRSASSSRAIPVSKMIKQVWNTPAMPIAWGVNKPGMQATAAFSGWHVHILKNLWQFAGRIACCIAWIYMKVGVHKQVANRILEPWQFMHTTLTTCKVTNFFNLRIHSAAQPEINYLATLMKATLDNRTPDPLLINGWHLPWTDSADCQMAQDYLLKQFSLKVPSSSVQYLLREMSAARCARSSYANFGGERSVAGDLSTYAKLVGVYPVHASPCEHQATPDTMENGEWTQPELHGNLTGYIQFRNTIPGHYKKD